MADYRVWMSEELLEGADFYLVGGTREISEAYLFITKKGAVQVEVELDDEKYLLESQDGR